MGDLLLDPAGDLGKELHRDSRRHLVLGTWGPFGKLVKSFDQASESAEGSGDARPGSGLRKGSFTIGLYIGSMYAWRSRVVITRP